MIYSTTADPSDGWSNHWSNGTKEPLICATCNSEIEDTELVKETCTYKGKKYTSYFCPECGDVFTAEKLP